MAERRQDLLNPITPRLQKREPQSDDDESAERRSGDKARIGIALSLFRNDDNALVQFLQDRVPLAREPVARYQLNAALGPERGNRLADLAFHRTSANSPSQEAVGSAGPAYEPIIDPGAMRAGSSGAELLEAAIDHRREGQALPQSLRAQFEASYETSLSAVRIHTDERASRAADQLGAEAFSVGQDVFFGTRRYSPDSEHGRFVLGHELAHVAQSGPAPNRPRHLPVEPIGSQHEMDASLAANRALDGMRAPLQRGAPVAVRFFAQGNGTRARGGHAYMTEQSLKEMGISTKEGEDGAPSDARRARMGNWMRDFSQLITPGWKGNHADAVGLLLDILAIKDFGKKVDPARLGSYDPVEHIDNPTGVRASDVMAQGPLQGSGYQPDHKGGETFSPAGSQTQAYADVDPRYAETATHGKIMNPRDAKAFQVDESGLPRYMKTSRELMKAELRETAMAGRGINASGDDRLRGPELFCSAAHTLQDFYAHSNFCEIAINLLIQSGTLKVKGYDRSVTKVGKHESLNSQVHALDSKGQPTKGNLRYAGREVMSTGTFDGHDSTASLVEEAIDVLKSIDPFAPKGKERPGLVDACLDYLDSMGTADFSRTYQLLADLIEPVRLEIQLALKAMGGVAQASGTVGGYMVEAAMRSQAAELEDAAGGDAQTIETARQFREAAPQARKDVSAAGNQLAQRILQVTKTLSAMQDDLRNRQHGLRDAVRWMAGNTTPLGKLRSAAQSIPGLGPVIADKLGKLEGQVDAQLRAALHPLWREGVEEAVTLLRSRAAKERSQTNMSLRHGPEAPGPKARAEAIGEGWVGDFYDQKTGKPRVGPDGQHRVGIAPGAYGPPSHTEVAKDHGDVHPVGERGSSDEFGAEEAAGHWLYQIAERLASRASGAVGLAVAKCWDVVDQGGQLAEDDSRLAKVNSVADHWLSHPADCRDTWEHELRGMIEAGGVVGPGLLAALRSNARQGH